MKKLTLTTLFILFYYIGFSQNKELINTLKQQLALEKQDTSRVMLLCEIGYKYRNFNADSGIIYIEQGFSLAKKIKFLR